MSFPANQTFNFFPVPTDVHFGPGVRRTLPERIKALGGTRVFVVTDPGIRAAGMLEEIEKLLRDAGLPHAVNGRVKPDSGSRLIDDTTMEFKATGADLVVAIGGGSSLDTAKAVAALATNPGSALDYVGLHKLKQRPVPTIVLPTTAGTGSEVTLWSVFTDDTRDLKVAIGSFLIYPTVALCDPELTLGLPPALTAGTGMDALGHATSTRRVSRSLLRWRCARLN
jgi:alcohol dehydrogenase